MRKIDITESIVEPKNQSMTPEYIMEIIKSAIEFENRNIGGYVVEVGENRYGRMQYLAFYCDSDEVDVSVVPSKGTLERVNKAIEQAKNKFEKENRRFWLKNNEISFKIVDSPSWCTTKIIS